MARGSCSSCTFSTLRPDGIMLCCRYPPGWQRAINYAGSPPPPTGSDSHALSMNWPVVRPADWCGEGADATSGVAFDTTIPAFTTVAQLPPATPALAGTRLFVTDGQKNHTVGDPLTGGGSLTIPAYCTGSAWLAG